jgi:hypothetical protein
VTDAVALSVNVQVLDLLPPLEHAPDQIASRPFDTLSVIDVPLVNDADPLVPEGTLMPAGLDVTRSPLRPVAVTANVTVCPGAVRVSVVVRVTPPALAVMVTGVDAITALVVTVKVALVAPCATVTLAGTDAALLLSLSATANPPDGAAAVNVTVPSDGLPPTTDVGFTAMAVSAACAAAPCGVKRRAGENGPATPAEDRARTRHHSCCAGNPLRVACDTLTVGFATNGADIVDELSTWTS